ncbi:MAG TPA: histidine kinase [Actinomycetaceae bacterium]|nr:histidine kinase [Actinomycetaceae bacterium]
MSPPASSQTPQRGWLATVNASHPRLIDLGVALLWALNYGVSYIFVEPETTSRGTFLLWPVLAAAILLRRRGAILSALIVLLAPPIVRFVEFGTLPDGVLLDAAPTLSEPGPFVDIIAVAIVVYTIAASRRIIEALAWGTLAAVVVAGTTALWGIEETRLGDAIFLELLLVVALLIGLNVRSNRKRIEAYEQRAQQLELERDQREQLAVSHERTRIAREMHDVVAHSLTVMVTLAEGALASLDRNPDGARRAIEELGNAGRSALADARRLVGVLRDDEGADPADAARTRTAASALPELFAPQPTTADFRELIEKYRSTGLPVTLEESGPPLPNDAGFHLAVYRIVQEALTNVLRHAPNSPRIDVAISRSRDTVVIEVENDAAPGGIAPGQQGKGLIGMRERAAVYGGSVEAGETEIGWRVRARLYWREDG